MKRSNIGDTEGLGRAAVPRLTVNKLLSVQWRVPDVARIIFKFTTDLFTTPLATSRFYLAAVEKINFFSTAAR